MTNERKRRCCYICGVSAARHNSKGCRVGCDDGVFEPVLKVYFGDGDALVTTFSTFVDQNEELSPEERELVRGLDVGSSCNFGGGAAPLVTVKRMA